MNVARSTEVGVSAEELYAWHSRPGAFERLVPPWERIRLLERHPGIEAGSRVRLETRVGPFVQTWVARHEDVRPGRGFVDVQERGPFARWRHRHRFDPAAAGRSVLADEIDFELPGGPLGELAEPLVRRRVRRTLRYRHEVTGGDVALHARFRDRPPLTVAITGASGLIGRSLRSVLTTGGHTVVPLVRRPPRDGEVRWDPDQGILDPAELSRVDAVVHLAGEGIADRRWTEAQRQRIRASRTAGTTTLVRAILAASPRPKALISASAIGFYGDRGDQLLTEDAAPGTGFLAEVVRDWEAGLAPAASAAIRTVSARFGLVLSPAGGTLAKMLLPFRLGIGGPLGTGRQWMSWVAIDDCVSSLVHLLFADLTGPVNVVAPEPVTNAAFTQALGRTLRRPAFLPVPAPLLRIVLGDLADEGVLASSRVEPRRLLDSGYRFRYPTLTSALSHELGKPETR